ncbi:MAG: hypothetical protein LC713_01730 [Actinobacteria bacterium]|nr:hypothetical protein [Actinomycetota bacterium]
MTAPENVPTWPELLEAQDRVIGRRQAMRGGLSAEGWSWRIGTARRGGAWQSPLPGVAIAHLGEPSFLERVWAAVIFGGPGAAASGDALLYLLSDRGLEPEVIDVAVRARCERVAREFFRPHRCAALPRLSHPVRQPPQLRAAPAVLHAAAWAASDRAAEWRLAAAVQRRLATVPQLREALPTIGPLRRRDLVLHVLDDVELGAHAQTELDFLAFLRRNNLPLPDRLQFLVRANGKRYLDGWWDKQRVAAEIDGAHHMEVASWDADGLRSNEIVVAHRADRVLLLRVTAGNMRHAEPQLAAQFRAVLL